MTFTECDRLKPQLLLHLLPVVRAVDVCSSTSPLWSPRWYLERLGSFLSVLLLLSFPTHVPQGILAPRSKQK